MHHSVRLDITMRCAVSLVQRRIVYASYRRDVHTTSTQRLHQRTWQGVITMECRDPGGWGGTAPLRRCGRRVLAGLRVCCRHMMQWRTTWIVLWVALPRTESVHISPGCAGILPSQARQARDTPYARAWVRGPLARMVRGPLACMVRCAVGSHRLAHQHAIGGLGLEPAPTVQ